MLIDGSLTFREMVVIEIYGLLLGLPERGKKLYIVPLSALDAVLRARSHTNVNLNTSVNGCSGQENAAQGSPGLGPGPAQAGKCEASGLENCSCSCLQQTPPGSAQPNEAVSRSPAVNYGAWTPPALLDKDALKCCKLQKSMGELQYFCVDARTCFDMP